MKKRSIVNLLSAAFMLIFFSACSKQQFTFAPGTGAYHGQSKQTPKVAATPETPAYAATETAAPAAEAISTPQTEASAALAKAVKATQQGTALVQNLNLKAKNATETSEKTNKLSLKQLKKEVKQLKKGIKDGKGEQGLGLNSNVKLLLILGLAFILVGALLNVGIIYTIGAILLIIGLVLLLMEIL